MKWVAFSVAASVATALGRRLAVPVTAPYSLSQPFVSIYSSYSSIPLFELIRRSVWQPEAPGTPCSCYSRRACRRVPG